MACIDVCQDGFSVPSRLDYCFIFCRKVQQYPMVYQQHSSGGGRDVAKTPSRLRQRETTRRVEPRPPAPKSRAPSSQPANESTLRFRHPLYLLFKHMLHDLLARDRGFCRHSGDIRLAGSDDGTMVSRIHASDIVGVVEASIERPQPGVVINVADDLPSTRYEV